MQHQYLKVAVPWSLSHYIALNGFHTLYRALFDHAPDDIEINAWDNFKLYNRFCRDIKIRETVLDLAKAEESKSHQLDGGLIEKVYREYYWPPNEVLTKELVGDIEFHHTAPFPSLERPFVFHCEAFAPVFIPFVQQGSGKYKNHKEIRDYYRSIFANPLCLGIFSHVPETLESFRNFFLDPEIDRKLFDSKIGLSANLFVGQEAPEKTTISKPRFLFTNSAHQNTKSFFNRGGHIVLRFWQEFKKSGRCGLLIIRCGKPSETELRRHGVDLSFLNTEMGHSILWATDYLTTDEMNALVASAHVFLLPSAHLHSASILHAMVLGAIPVITDTVGTSVYVADDEHGIVLHGVRSALWHTDPDTGVLVDDYSEWLGLADSLVTQMTARILALLDMPDAYQQMQNRSMAHVQQQFSGHAFSSQFWNAVSDLYQNHKQSSFKCDTVSSKVSHSLFDCMLQRYDWARVFESVPQPMLKIYTGVGNVFEQGGVTVYTAGKVVMKQNDWCVFSDYFDPDAPQKILAYGVDTLKVDYLSFEARRGRTTGNTRLIQFVSKILMPFPEMHSFAASALKKLRLSGHIHLFLKYLAFLFSNKLGREADIELVCHSVNGYNIVRYFHKYYAILQKVGAFKPGKERYSSYSYERLFRKISTKDTKTGSTKLTRFVSKILKPHPALHSFAASALKNIFLCRNYFVFRFGHKYDVVLVRYDVCGYNIVFYHHIYYGIKQIAGNFKPGKESYSSRSYEELYSQINSAAGNTNCD